jgi:NitT/TauT family transport system substrate-binding protein
VQALATRDFGYLPTIVAVSKGFFAEEGLEVEQPAMPVSTAIPAILSKEIPIGPNAVRAAYQGAPARTVFYQFSRITFLGVGASGIQSYADLPGKVLAVSVPGSAEDLAMKLILQREGIPLSDVQIVPLGPSPQRAQALLGGQAHVSLLNPDLALGLERRGFNILGHVRDLMPVPFGGFSVHEDTVRDQAPWLKPWLRANIRGVQFVKRNPTEAAEIAVKELSVESDIALKAIELIVQSLDDEDPGGFSEAGILLGTQLDMEVVGLTGDPSELARRANDVTTLRQVQREMGIRCTRGYQCQ